MIRRAMKFAFSAVIVTVVVVGFSAVVTPSAAAFKRCICPDVYAPVTCSNGVTYSNACVAGCARATGCVPSGGI